MASTVARSSGRGSGSKSRSARNAILDQIGKQQLIRIEEIWVYPAYLSPSGSVKDIVAQYMLETAFEDGRLEPGGTVIEATTGGMGMALALVGGVMGVTVILLQPFGMTPERRRFSSTLGADVREVGQFHANEALDLARELACEPGTFFTNQFGSEDNVLAHRTVLGPRILSQLASEGVTPDAIVAGAGTGATVVGNGLAFRDANPDAMVAVMEPAESRTLEHGKVAPHLLDGINDGFVSDIMARHRSLIDEIIPIPGESGVEEAKRLAREYKLSVGPTSGANFLAAKELKRRYPQLEHAVTIFPDAGWKYFTTHFGGEL